jgi:hypothetical protein
MKYFSYISNTYSLKNSLEKAVFGLLCQENRKIIDEENVQAFKDNISKRVKELNASFPRCKPITIDWYQPQLLKDDKDIHLHMSAAICNYHLFNSNS